LSFNYQRDVIKAILKLRGQIDPLWLAWFFNERIHELSAVEINEVNGGMEAVIGGLAIGAALILWCPGCCLCGLGGLALVLPHDKNVFLRKEQVNPAVFRIAAAAIMAIGAGMFAAEVAGAVVGGIYLFSGLSFNTTSNSTKTP
jgi:hypothetical protein